MVRHREVIEAARLAQTDAEDRVYTSRHSLDEVRNRYLNLRSPVGPLLRAFTSIPRGWEGGRLVRRRDDALLNLTYARKIHESLVTVDGLELDTLRSPNGSFLERISGLLEDTPIVAAHLVVVQKWLEGPELRPVEVVLREGFGGNRGGRRMRKEDADAFFRQFQTVLVERNKTEGVSDKSYPGNLVTLFNKLACF